MLSTVCICYSHSRSVNYSFNRNRWKKTRLGKPFWINYFEYFRYWKVGYLGSCYSDEVKKNYTGKLPRKCQNQKVILVKYAKQILQSSSVQTFCSEKVGNKVSSPAVCNIKKKKNPVIKAIFPSVPSEWRCGYYKYNSDAWKSYRLQIDREAVFIFNKSD